MDFGYKSLKGHEASVKSVAFSHDGSKLATGSNDYTIKIWLVESGINIQTFSGHSGIVRYLVFSNDGLIIASGSDDNTIKLWSLESDQIIKTFEGHTGPVSYLGFSNDGLTIASGSDDKTIKIWLVESGKNIQTLNEHTTKIVALAFTSDGTQLMSASANKTLCICSKGAQDKWNSFKKIPVASLTDREWDKGVAFSPTGKYMIGCNEVINMNDGKHLCFIWEKNEVIHAAFSSDDQYIVVCIYYSYFKQKPNSFALLFPLPDSKNAKFNKINDKRILLNIKNLQFFSNIENSERGHNGQINYACFSHDGKFIATGGTDKTAIIWSIKTGQKDETPPYINGGGSTSSMDVNSDGVVATINGNNLIINNTHVKSLYNSNVNHIDYDISDSKCLTFSSKFRTKNKVKLFTIAVSCSITQPANNTKGINGDREFGKVILILDEDYDPNGKKYTWDWGFVVILDNKDRVESIMISPDNKFLVTGSDNGTVIIWKYDYDSKIKLIMHTTFKESHKARVNSVVFSGDSNYVASGSMDKTINIWKKNSQGTKKNIIDIWEHHKTLAGHTGGVTSLAFRADGVYLASGSVDSSVIIWKVENGESIQKLEGHSENVGSVAFSPNGKFLATGSWDTTVKIWSTKPEKWEVIRTQGYLSHVFNVRFYGNDSIIASTYNAIIYVENMILDEKNKSSQGGRKQTRPQRRRYKKKNISQKIKTKKKTFSKK